MNIHRALIFATTTILSISAYSPVTLAAGRVQLELIGEARGTALSFQDWVQALAGAGVKNVRLHSATSTDKVGIDIQGTADNPLYIVTGQVQSRDEIQLPGVRFKRSEVKRLAAWLDDLALNGPPDKRPKLVAFGLTAVQFDQMMKDLSAPVGFSTQGLACSDAVEKIARKLSLPLQFEGSSSRKPGDDKVEDEFSNLSCGTALACLLRQAGYGFAPQTSDGKIRYTVFKSPADSKEIWPIGRPPEKPLPEVLPALFEFRNVNVQNVSAAAALDAIGKRLKTPVLYDRLSLAKHKIDPAKAMVNFPNSKTNYSMALGKMLFPVGLKFEVRVDESGTPFLWIYTVKPM